MDKPIGLLRIRAIVCLCISSRYKPLILTIHTRRFGPFVRRLIAGGMSLQLLHNSSIANRGFGHSLALHVSVCTHTHAHTDVMEVLREDSTSRPLRIVFVHC